MSEINATEPNGPATDIALSAEPAEGVKVVPGNNTSNTPSLQPLQAPTRPTYYQQTPTNQPSSSPQGLYQYQQSPQYPNVAGSRPVLRRSDSRNTLQYRQPVPYINQNPQQNLSRPPSSVQPRPQSPSSGGPYYGPRPVLSQGPRYPPPGVQQGVRYGETQPESPFRRAVNAVSEGHRLQRPVQPGPRPPGVYPQKMMSNVTPPPTAMEPKKNPMQEYIAPSDSNTQNGSTYELNKPTKPTTDDDKKYEDIRPSSALGYVADPEKDIDTSEVNGKDNHPEEIPERPESRTGFLSREHSSHSNMHKIDEDDDDAVITPSRRSHLARSGKSTPSTNSIDNIPQKYAEYMEKPTKSDTPELKKTPSITSLDSPQNKKPVTVPHADQKRPITSRNSSDNLSLKSSDVEATKPLKDDLEYAQISGKYTPEVKPVSAVSPIEKISRTPPPHPPSSEKVVPPSTVETPRSYSPEKDKPKRVPSVKKLDITSPASAPTSRASPSPREHKVTRKSSSPRVESKYLSGRRTPSSKLRRQEGDNDSGVDETTQGNDRSYNGEQASPRKTPTKVSKLPSSKCKTPVKMLQSPKSPDPASQPSTTDKKKVPMNKVQVGSAPSPNIKTVKSKIGSLENASYKPGGGKIKLENKKIDFSKVQPRIAAKNDAYQPGGGDKKVPQIQQQKLQWNAKSKVGSLENATYKPGGGDKKIETIKLDFKDKAKSKVGSKDNIKHIPGGGDVKSVEEDLQEDIENRKIEISAQSKVGSLDNVKHKPGGGDVKIFDDKDYIKQRASGEHSVLSGSQNSLRSQQSQPEPSEPVSDENLNQER